jgi:type I restriction enzyme S subunit
VTARDVELGAVAAFVRGVTFKPDDVTTVDGADTVLCMRTSNVQTILDTSDVWRIPSELARRSDQYLRAGDILVSSANSWNLVGKCCWVPELPGPATFGGFVSVLRADPQELDSRYVYWWFSAPRTQQLVRSFGRRTTSISNLDLARSLRLKIPLPPLDEQRRIARVLDIADRIRERRRASFDVVARLRDAVFAAATATSPRPWPLVRVADLVDESNGGMRTGPFGSQLLHSEFVEVGVAVLGIDNAVSNEYRRGAQRYITEDKYDELRRYTVHPGDVLITIMGTCGRAAVVPDDIGIAINTKHLCCISLDRSRCLPNFLHAYFLRHPVARRYLMSRAKGAIMAGLNMGIIRDLPVSLPPIEIQRDLGDRLAEIDRVHQRAVAHGGQLDALFASLQHRAFVGAL